MIGAAILAAVLAGTVPAPAPGMPAAMGNIIITVTGKVPLPAAARALGKTRNLAWAACPPDAGARRDSGIFLAYLDEGDFRAETKALTGAQVAEVMRKRIREEAQFLSDMGDQAAGEAGAVGAWTGNGALLDIHREGYFTGRFIHETAEDIRDLARERVHLQALEGEFLSRRDCPPSVAESLRQRDTSAALARLAKAAEAWGMPGMGRLRRDAVPRILYSRDLLPALAAGAGPHDLAAEKAGKGFLMPQTPGEIAKLPVPMPGFIAFLDPAESARAVRLSTRAQLERRLAGLESAGGVGPRDYLEAILACHLRMLATLRMILSSPKAQLPSQARSELAGLETQVRSEARQAAIDALGPFDAGQSRALLARLRAHLKTLADFSAVKDPGLAEWSRRSAAALASLTDPADPVDPTHPSIPESAP